MAVQTGTASNYLDLLAQLNTFLTGMATNPWTLLASNTNTYSANGGTATAEYYWKAPGLTGTEAIYINARAYYNAGSDYYNIELRGAQGYSSGNAFVSQPGVSPAAFMYLWNQPINYWFVANGQRVIIIVKVSTVYESAYLGKFLPYGTPGQYPYPVAIGGTGYSGYPGLRFSDTSGNHAAFFDPAGLYVCDPGGTWQIFQHYNVNLTTANLVLPYIYYSTSRPNFITANLDGSYSILPVVLAEYSAVNLLGEFDGVGFITGNANGSENTINDGTNTWMALQNTFRTTADTYCTIKMA